MVLTQLNTRIIKITKRLLCTWSKIMIQIAGPAFEKLSVELKNASLQGVKYNGWKTWDTQTNTRNLVVVQQKPLESNQKARIWNPCSTLPSCYPRQFTYHLFVCLFPLLATLWHMGFLDQGSDLSRSWDPSHNCSNARSLNHSTRPRNEPMRQSSQDAIGPIAPQWEFLTYHCILNIFIY